MVADIPTAVAKLCSWSDWVPFADALETAPRLPGVYLVREARGEIIYVGCAGPREGSGKPEGLRGRLRVYRSGKALTSGLGEAVADRAFADAVWLRERLDEVERGEPRRATDWGKLAFERSDLYVCWSTTADKATAVALELACGIRLPELWNRKAFGSTS